MGARGFVYVPPVPADYEPEESGGLGESVGGSLDSEEIQEKQSKAKPLDFKLRHLWMVSQVGPFRLAHAVKSSFALPGGAGTNTPIEIAANGGEYVKYVRVTSPAGGGITYLNHSSGMSLESADVVNLGVAPFVEYILLPGERLWAQNQAGVAFRVTVFNVDVPFRTDTW